MKKNGKYGTIVSVDQLEGTITLAHPDDAAHFEVGMPITIDMGRGFWKRLLVFMRKLPEALSDLWDCSRWL